MRDTSVVDPHHFDADLDVDPDSTYHPDADPYLDFLFDADADPTLQPNADPDPDTQLPKKAQTLEKMLKLAHILYILACRLQSDAVRIRFWIQLWIQLITLMRIRILIFS